MENAGHAPFHGLFTSRAARHSRPLSLASGEALVGGKIFLQRGMIDRLGGPFRSLCGQFRKVLGMGTHSRYGSRALTQEAKESILAEFRRANRLGSLRFSYALSAAICEAVSPYFSLIETLDKIDPNDPTSGLLIAFADRTYTTACGALSLLALGHFREAEVLARTIFESSVTLVHICLLPEQRFVQFFRQYLVQEREQARKWKGDIGGLSTNQQAVQLQFIHKREHALDLYERIVNDFASQLKIDPKKLPPLASLLDRVTEFGNRLDYRTFYASMCSQAHHDAEDLLNRFIAGGIDPEVDYGPQAKAETDSFSLFMVLFALSYFVSAIGAISIRQKLVDAQQRCEASRSYFELALKKMLPHLDSATFPVSWQVPETS